MDLRVVGGRASSSERVLCPSWSWELLLPYRMGDAPKDPPGDIVPGVPAMVPGVSAGRLSGFGDVSRLRFLLFPRTSGPAENVCGILSNKG